MNVEPEAGTQVTTRDPSTRSLAVAAKVAIAPPGPVASSVRSAGSTRIGAVSSVIFTVNDAVPVLPWASVAEHVTSVSPTGKPLPDAGTHVVDRLPSTASVAPGLAQVAVVRGPPASNWRLVIVPTVGAVVS